jgi:hypothetical protein
MRKLLLATALVVALIAPATANDFDIIRGEITRDYGTTIILGLKNNTQTTIPTAMIDCGFYRGDELVGADHGVFKNLELNQIGYSSAHASDKDVTRIDCRVDMAQP